MSPYHHPKSVLGRVAAPNDRTRDRHLTRSALTELLAPKHVSPGVPSARRIILVRSGPATSCVPSKSVSRLFVPGVVHRDYGVVIEDDERARGRWGQLRKRRVSFFEIPRPSQLAEDQLWKPCASDKLLLTRRPARVDHGDAVADHPTRNPDLQCMQASSPGRSAVQYCSAAPPSRFPVS